MFTVRMKDYLKTLLENMQLILVLKSILLYVSNFTQMYPKYI